MSNTFTKSILPISLIVSAFVLNIHNIKATFSATPPLKENILNIEGGKVNLGTVTAEREKVNILVYLDKDNESLFHIGSQAIEDLKAGSSTLDKPIINITNEPPSQAVIEFKRQLTDFISLLNKDKTDSDKITIQSLISHKGFAVRVNSYIGFDSSLQGKFNLLIDEKEYTVEKDTPLLPVIIPSIESIVNETIQEHKKETFM